MFAHLMLPSHVPGSFRVVPQELAVSTGKHLEQRTAACALLEVRPRIH